MELHQFSMFEYGLHLIIDIFYAVIAWAVVDVIRRSRWTHHLAWAMPGAVSSNVLVAYRLVLDANHFFGWGTDMFVFVASKSLWYLSVAIGMYSTWLFWRTLRDVVKQANAADLFTQMFAADAAPGVWLPPPVRVKE